VTRGNGSQFDFLSRRIGITHLHYNRLEVFLGRKFLGRNGSCRSCYLDGGFKVFPPLAEIERKDFVFGVSFGFHRFLHGFIFFLNLPDVVVMSSGGVVPLSRNMLLLPSAFRFLVVVGDFRSCNAKKYRGSLNHRNLS
jgi:hypothetical protein